MAQVCPGTPGRMGRLCQTQGETGGTAGDAPGNICHLAIQEARVKMQTKGRQPGCLPFIYPALA